MQFDMVGVLLYVDNVGLHILKSNEPNVNSSVYSTPQLKLIIIEFH